MKQCGTPTCWRNRERKDFMAHMWDDGENRYRTSDGQVFNTGYDAERHQAELDRQAGSSGGGGSGPKSTTPSDILAFNEGYFRFWSNGDYNSVVNYVDQNISKLKERTFDHYAIFRIGESYFKVGRYEEALNWLSIIARLTYKEDLQSYIAIAKAEVEKAKALVDQGADAYNAKDYAKAIPLFQKAADMGNKIAMYNLGNAYRNGNGVPKDMTKAAEWYEKAADNGQALAMNGLGYCYLNGNGKPKDQAKAVEWFRKAIDAGNISAMCSLGECYRDGTGVKQDFAEAEKWINKSIANGGGDAEKAELAKLKEMRGY